MGSILVKITVKIQEPKAEIRIHWIIEKVTNKFWSNFMESWGVAQRPTDYILVTIRITIRIRSPFRITIRIREELPRCQHTYRTDALLDSGCGPGTKWLHFADDPDHRSPKSEIRIHWILAFGGGLHSLSTSSWVCRWKDFKNRSTCTCTKLWQKFSGSLFVPSRASMILRFLCLYASVWQMVTWSGSREQVTVIYTISSWLKGPPRGHVCVLSLRRHSVE